MDAEALFAAEARVGSSGSGGGGTRGAVGARPAPSSGPADGQYRFRISHVSDAELASLMLLPAGLPMPPSAAMAPVAAAARADAPAAR